MYITNISIYKAQHCIIEHGSNVRIYRNLDRWIFLCFQLISPISKNNFDPWLLFREVISILVFPSRLSDNYQLIDKSALKD